MMSATIQIKMLKVDFYMKLFQQYFQFLANLELLKKFLEKIIANLPDANPTESIEINEYPYSTKVNNKPSLRVSLNLMKQLHMFLNDYHE